GPGVLGGTGQGLNVGDGGRGRPRPDRRFDVLHERPQRDYRTNPDGDADEKEQQPPPRRPHLAPGKIDHESHLVSSPRTGTGTGNGEWGVGAEFWPLALISPFTIPHSPLPIFLSSTIRPPLREILRSALSARLWSCVTSNRVVP